MVWSLQLTIVSINVFIINSSVLGVYYAPCKSNDQTKFSSTPWLQIYVGQPDSIALLLHALNITVGSTDQQRTAGRLVVEVLRGKPTRLRFILDGVDIGEALKLLGICHGQPPICTSASFLAFLRGPRFWGFFIPTTFNSSEAAYTTLCASADFRTMV